MATLILDDRNPEIVYSVGWSAGGAPAEYDSTTTYTDVAGATMSLTFQGISVSVYGTIGSSNSQRVAPQTTYQLDGSEVVTYIPTLMASAQHKQQFYQSAQNRKGQHTLVVTNVIGGCDPFFIDYLIVQTGNASESSTTITALRTTQVSPSDSEQPASGWTAIIAGTTSTALACMLLVGLYFWLRKRKRQEPAGLSNELSVVGSMSPFQHTDQSPVDPKRPPSTQLQPLVHNHAGSSRRDSVDPPPYIP